MRFIISVFGNDFIGLLLTAIYSIQNTNPGAAVSIFWEDIDKGKINVLKKAFSKVDFIQTNFNFSHDPIKRISSKTLAWAHAAKKYQGEKLCFLDVDMLVVKDISHFFAGNDFHPVRDSGPARVGPISNGVHIAYTYKNEHYPLNTGVILSDGSKEATNFFTLWGTKTMEIINDKELFKQANDTTLSYGGSDQMSFMKIMGYRKERNDKNYVVENGGIKIRFKGIPCRILNETNSVPITKDTHIIHYKGVWQKVLIKGMNFSKYRTKKDSWEMYMYFLNNYKQAVQFINKKLGANYPLSFFNITVPFYVNLHTLKENRILYYIHFIIKQIQQITFLTTRKIKKVISF